MVSSHHHPFLTSKCPVGWVRKKMQKQRLMTIDDQSACILFLSLFFFFLFFLSFFSQQTTIGSTSGKLTNDSVLFDLNEPSDCFSLSHLSNIHSLLSSFLFSLLPFTCKMSLNTEQFYMSTTLVWHLCLNSHYTNVCLVSPQGLRLLVSKVDSFTIKLTFFPSILSVKCVVSFCFFMWK